MDDLRVNFPRPCDEPWEKMTPTGCNRVCARCDQVIHDLSNYTIDEAETLLSANPDTCVRARIDPRGAVVLKPAHGGSVRRMVIAASASVGLLATATPALAKKGPEGAIAGMVQEAGFVTGVTAVGADGKTYRAKVRLNGRYKIRHLLPGTYKLTFEPSCGDQWSVDGVVVADGMIVTADTRDPNGCIIVGRLEIDDGSRAA